MHSLCYDLLLFRDSVLPLFCLFDTYILIYAAYSDYFVAAGANCNKSCYNKAGLLPTKKLLFKLCGVSGVKILSTTPPPIADIPRYEFT